MKIAPFMVDITPPVGHPLAFGINEGVETPICIRGCVVAEAASRVVFASADAIQIGGDAYVHMKEAVAKAAGAPPSNVFLHSVHQHDSVRICPGLNGICKRFQGFECTPLPYYEKLLSDLEKSVAGAVRRFAEVESLGAAERRLCGLASNRRLLDANGKVYAMRWSMCDSPELQREPTGLIDPFLRSVGFLGKGGRLIAAMHFYASHPMTAYKRSRVGADVPGAALDFLRRHSKEKAFHIYFTGCGGNVTFGKYSIKPPEKSVRALGERLGKGLLANCKALEKKAMGPVVVAERHFEFPLEGRVSEERMRKIISEGKDKESAFRHSIFLEAKRQWRKWRKASVSRVSLGPDVHILSMPAETVVEYQLYAQSLVPEKFLACAAYANGIYQYIPTARMFDEGGYEPEHGSITNRKVEERMKDAIRGALEDLL